MLKTTWNNEFRKKLVPNVPSRTRSLKKSSTTVMLDGSMASFILSGDIFRYLSERALPQSFMRRKVKCHPLHNEITTFNSNG